jgi:hypothetical protein
MKKKVTASTLDQFGSGTLIRTYDKLGEVNSDDDEKAISAIQFQTKISQELESRGWIYDETIGDWVYPRISGKE